MKALPACAAMKKYLAPAVIVLAVTAITVAGLVYRSRTSPEGRRARLVSSFLACVPDSLNEARRDEIRGLFDQLWFRYDRGLVLPADLDTVMTRVREVIDAGEITGPDLVYLMAQVGYFTYHGEQRYNLPDSSVDHPTLNPDADVATLFPDSAIIAEFNAWLEEMERQGKDPEQELRRLRGLPPLPAKHSR